MIFNFIASHSVCALAAIMYAVLLLGVLRQGKFDL